MLFLKLLSTKWLSTLIALAALILTQLPPVGSWFGHHSVEGKIARTIACNQLYGKPAIQTNITVTNLGNRTLTCDKIELHLAGGGKERILVSDQLINPNGMGMPGVFGALRIKPDENWSGVVIFHEVLTTEEDKDWSMFRAQLAANSTRMPFIEPAPAQLEKLKELSEMAQAKFNQDPPLRLGAYTAEFRFFDKDTLLTSSRFSFVLYDYHLQLLRDQALNIAQPGNPVGGVVGAAVEILLKPEP